MTDTAEIRTIPIANIDILNPRARNRKVFDELVESIASVGLKRPVTVRQVPGSKRYELVCGQGRMEAFQQLGQSTIEVVPVFWTGGYLHAFETGSQLRAGLGRWITYYNTQRPHSGLAGRTPVEAYRRIGQSGGMNDNRD